MNFTNAGLAIIKKFEGFSAKAYRDIGGVPTIGFGHTGPDVQMGDEISELEAENLLRGDLLHFDHGVLRLLTAPTNDNEFSAMVSLAYNIGLGAFQKSSVLKFHNQGKKALAKAAFLLWIKVNGHPLNGLIRRRTAEANLYAS